MINVRRILLSLFVLGLGSSGCLAQSVSVVNKLTWIMVDNPGKKMSAEELPILRDPSKYGFYELVDPDGVGIHAEPRDMGITVVDPLPEDDRVLVKLNQPVLYGKIYLLKISGTWGGKPIPVLRFELKKESSAKVYNNPRDQLYLESNVGLSDLKVAVKETTFSISKDKKNLVVKPVDLGATAKARMNKMTIDFHPRLSEATNHYLVINHFGEDGTLLKAKAKVMIPGLPSSPQKSRIDLLVSSEFGQNLKPQFNLSGVFKQRFLGTDSSTFFLEPALAVDVGLGSTKSKNAITLDLPLLRYSFDLPRKGGCDGKPELKESVYEVVENKHLTDGETHLVKLPCYAEWNGRNPWKLYSVDVKAGPRFETDRTFGRANVLGTVRFNMNFDRWQHSISNQQAYLQTDLENTEYRDNFKDVHIKSGFDITPRFGVEFGRKVTAEVIHTKNDKIRFVIPQYPIFRSYVGFASVFEWNYRFLPIKLSVTEDLFYLGYQEMAGEIKDNALNLRRVRGFQPYGKLSLDIALDPVKRYNFNVTYENGRAAPNFEYLNSVKSGIRIVY